MGFWVFIPHIVEAVSIRQQWQFSPAGGHWSHNPQAQRRQSAAFQDRITRAQNDKDAPFLERVFEI